MGVRDTVYGLWERWHAANSVGEGGFSFQSEQLDSHYSITMERDPCGWEISLLEQQPGDDQVSKKPKLQANLLLGVASVMLERKVLAMRTLRANLRAHHTSFRFVLRCCLLVFASLVLLNWSFR